MDKNCGVLPFVAKNLFRLKKTSVFNGGALFHRIDVNHSFAFINNFLSRSKES